jgi:hypothetical protein
LDQPLRADLFGEILTLLVSTLVAPDQCRAQDLVVLVQQN